MSIEKLSLNYRLTSLMGSLQGLKIWQALPLIMFLIISYPSADASKGQRSMPQEKIVLGVTSKAFSAEQRIPSKYTADGSNISPPLHWTIEPRKPDALESFALICDDPDAPGGTWIHWVIFNIAKQMRDLPEGVSPLPTWENGPEQAQQGFNSFGKLGYGGPAPPPGKLHHYRFRFYALNTKIFPESKVANLDAQRLESAMQGHIISQATLVGTYSR